MEETEDPELSIVKNLNRYDSMKKTNKNLTSHAEHLDQQYGKRGTKKREEYEEGFEAFKLGVVLPEKRNESGMV